MDQKSKIFFLLVTISSCSGLYRWKNDEIEAIRTNNPQVGNPLIIAVRHRGEYLRHECKFTSPSFNTHYWIRDGVVVDEEGNAVDGVEPWDDGGDSSVCGIRIASMQDIHDEEDDLNSHEWEIALTFTEGGLFGQEDLNGITVGIHLKDDNILKPELEDYLGFTPIHYDLSIIPDLTTPNQTISFKGTAKIELQVDDYPGFIIPVNMFAIDIRKLGGVLRRQNGSEESLRFGRLMYNLQEDTIIMFALNEFLHPGDTVIPEIEYDANVNFNVFNGYGIWKQPCLGSQDTKHCWFTQFEAAGARQMFPCFDEPRAKATFDMRVARTDGWNTLFNTPIAYTEPVEGMDGWVWDVFQTTPKMSTYTMALAIQDFASVPAAGNMTIWAIAPYVEAGFTDYAAEVGPKCVSATEEVYKIPYMLPKMDMVHVNNFGGAMENWGLILYEFDYLLYDSSIPDPDNDRKFDVLETIAHELSHMWYGNLVTMAWWDQLWLNEGFATYVSHLIADIVDPNIHSWDRFIAERHFYIMGRDSRPSTWALSNPVTSIDDISRKFGLISYWKGGSVVRMMESFLGKDTFNKGLTNYLTAMSYSASIEEDLFIQLESAGLEDGVWPQNGIEDLTEAMKTWTQQAGLPIVNVSRNADNNIVLSQAWYQNAEITANEKLWSIPITIVDLASADQSWEDTTPTLWLTEIQAEVSIEGSGGPVIPMLNKMATGFYRVTYDADIWSDIINILNTDHQSIHPYNRVQLICDAAHMSAHGHLDQNIADQVLGYYADNEKDWVVNRAYAECVGGFHRDKQHTFRRK